MEKSESINLIYLTKTDNDENQNNTNEDKNQKETNIEFIKNRYYIFDNFKGILIFTVVFGHFLLDYSNKNLNTLSRKIVVFIYSFHMQAFVFISGFLSSDNSIKLINAVKLLILYYIFNFTFSILLYFYINSPINFVSPKYSYWYILSLFHWRILIKYLNHVKFLFFISFIISFLAGYWDCFSNVLSISRTITFFPYFILGYKIAKRNIIDKFILWKGGKLNFFKFLIFTCFFLRLTILYIKKKNISNSTLLMGAYNKTNTLKDRVCTIIISLIMILIFLLILPNKKIPILNNFGKNSLYIYLFHRIFAIISQKQFFSYNNNSDYIIVYSLLFTLIILFIFGSDTLTKICNSFLNSIHKNIIEDTLKGKIILNIFYLSFICILMIRPVSIYYRQKESNENYLIKKKTLTIKNYF